MNAEIIVTLITGSFTIGGMVVKFYLDRKMKQIEKNKVLVPMLVNHPIFSRLEMLKTHIAMSFQMPNKGKELVFKDLLINNIDIWRDVLRELAEKLDGLDDSTENTILHKIISEYFEYGIKNFSNYYRTNLYTIDEQRSLDIVMAKFNKWNYPRIQQFHDTITGVCNSQFYSGVKVKSAVIMDMYVSMFVDVINDAEATIGEINGDLKGLIFRNVTI